MWVFLFFWKRSVAGGDGESEICCTLRVIGMMHDIATTHGTCGEMSDGADSADSADSDR